MHHCRQSCPIEFGILKGGRAMALRPQVTRALTNSQSVGIGCDMTFLTPQVLQLLAAARIAQLAQRLDLNLPDALAGEPQALAHLSQCAFVSIDQPKA